MEKISDEFIEKYRIPIYKYCYCKLKFDVELTDKTVSDIWITVIKKAEKLRSGSDIKAYLYRVADKCILHNLSRKKSEASRKMSYDDVAGETYTIDEYFSDDRTEEELAQDLALALPEEDRELFTQRFIQKLTIQDISERTGVPYSTIRLHIERIKKHIKRILKENNHIPRIRKGGEFDEQA